MSRSISDIKKLITDAFLSDSNLRKAYGIKVGDKWDDTFSSVSVENIIIYIFSACTYMLEQMFENFKNDVDNLVTSNIVPTVRWYHSQALKFQLGDKLEYDEEKQAYDYPVNDEQKKIIKYAAVRDAGNTIEMLVSKDDGGHPVMLSNSDLIAFKHYMSQVKIAGVLLNIQSLPADSIRIEAKIFIDPQILRTDGTRIIDGKSVVIDAINEYLKNIVYGGTYNKTRCVDAIQRVEGVLDIELIQVSAKSSSELKYTIISTNNYTAKAGCFIGVDLNNSISYVV